jgi:hypothetical protein
VKVWSDRAYLVEDAPYVPALYPLWGKPPGLERFVAWPEFADELVARGGELFQAAELEAADLAVFPLNWKRVARSQELVERAQEFAARARAAGKPLAVFFEGDSDEPVPLEGATVLRTSLYRSRRRPREFALAAFHDDLLAYTGGELPLREKAGRPVVGFCGWLYEEPPPRGLAGRTRRALGDRRRRVLERRGEPLPQDVFVRSRALRALEAQDAVATNVVLREEGGGGALYPRLDRERWRVVRAEYVRNSVESDYVLCARGAGNWSWRFYETLSLGRIPVFVDTDCVLPYDFLLDWREHVVWVDRTELPRIGEQVAGFHERLSDAEFRDRQRACRRLWEDYLAPFGFFANLHRHFE